MTGFQAAPAAMREAADGIAALVGELGSLTTAGRAGEGRGVPAVELGPDQLGHDGLAAAFSRFCFRWDWGVRALVQDGTAMAAGLRESVAGYEQADGDIGSALSQLVDEMFGDPAADPERSAGRTPLETFDGAARDLVSGERWSRAGESITDAWAGVAQDARTTADDRFRRGLAGENPYGPDVDSLREIVD